MRITQLANLEQHSQYKIGIVIPCFNSASFLPNTLHSIQQQSVSNWCVQIVDDGSTDATVQLAQSLASTDERIRIYSQKNHGVAHARNRGFALLPSVDYVLFLDHDDCLLPAALEELSGYLAGHSSAAGVHGELTYIDAQSCPLDQPVSPRYILDKWKLRRSNDNEPTTLATLCVWPCIKTPGQLLVKYSVLLQIGVYDPNTVPSDDWDLQLRVAIHQPLLFLPCPVLKKRIHAGNASNDQLYLKRGEPSVRTKLASSPFLDSQQRQLVRRGHLYSVGLRFLWSYQSARQGAILEAVKQIGRMIRAFIAYRRLWH